MGKCLVIPYVKVSDEKTKKLSQEVQTWESVDTSTKGVYEASMLFTSSLKFFEEYLGKNSLDSSTVQSAARNAAKVVYLIARDPVTYLGHRAVKELRKNKQGEYTLKSVLEAMKKVKGGEQYFSKILGDDVDIDLKQLVDLGRVELQKAVNEKETITEKLQVFNSHHLSKDYLAVPDGSGNLIILEDSIKNRKHHKRAWRKQALLDRLFKILDANNIFSTEDLENIEPEKIDNFIQAIPHLLGEKLENITEENLTNLVQYSIPVIAKFILANNPNIKTRIAKVAKDKDATISLLIDLKNCFNDKYGNSNFDFGTLLSDNDNHNQNVELSDAEKEEIIEKRIIAICTATLLADTDNILRRVRTHGNFLSWLKAALTKFFNSIFNRDRYNWRAYKQIKHALDEAVDNLENNADEYKIIVENNEILLQRIANLKAVYNKTLHESITETKVLISRIATRIENSRLLSKKDIRAKEASLEAILSALANSQFPNTSLEELGDNVAEAVMNELAGMLSEIGVYARGSLMPSPDSESYWIELNKVSEAYELIAIFEQSNALLNTLETIENGDNTLRFKDTIDSMRGTLSSLKKELDARATVLIASYMADVYGDQSFLLEGYLEGIGLLKTVIKSDEAKSFRDVLTKINKAQAHDSGTFTSLFISASKSRDLLLLIMDDLTKRHIAKADQEANQAFEKLMALKEEAEDLGLKPEDFYEYDGEGIPTGNFLSSVDSVAIEPIKQALIKEAEIKFKTKSDASEQRRLIQEYVEEGLQERCYEYNTVLETWLPKKEYQSARYNKLFNPQDPNFGKKVALLTKVKNYKNELDKRIFKNLDDKSPVLNHVPQYTACKRRESYNRGNAGQRFTMFKTFWNRLRYLVVLKEDEEEFSRPELHNIAKHYSKDFISNIKKEGFKQRVPVYGVAPISNKLRLDTDIWGSLARYTVSTMRYEKKNEIAGFLEATTHLAKKRQIIEDTTADTPLSSEAENEIRNCALEIKASYKNFDMFLQTKVYNDKRAWGKNRYLDAVRPAIRSLTQYSAWKFLAGNVMGGFANTMNGIFETLRAACAGMYATKYKDNWKSFSRAITYALNPFASFGGFFRDTAQVFGGDNMSRFLRHFNLLENVDTKLSNYNSTEGKVAKFILEGANYAPYSMGDRIMQFIPAAAIAENTVVYVGDTKTNLAELTLYHPDPDWNPNNTPRTWKVIDENDDLAVRYLNPFKGMWTKTEKGAEKAAKYLRMKEIFKAFLNEVQFDHSIPVNDDAVLGKFEDWFVENSNKYYPSNISEDTEKMESELKWIKSELQKCTENLGTARGGQESIASLLDSYGAVTIISNHCDRNIKRNVWTHNDDTTFANKAKDMNEELHGIYNKQSMTAVQELAGFTALAQMRGYIFGMVERRFSRSYHDIKHTKVKGDDLIVAQKEGAYLTLYKAIVFEINQSLLKNHDTVFGSILRSPRTMWNVISLLLLGTSEHVDLMGLSERQRANLRFCVADMFMTCVIGPLVASIVSGFDGYDDDEEEEFAATGLGEEEEEEDLSLPSLAVGWALYALGRVSAEQSFFSPFSALSRGWNSALSSAAMFASITVTADLLYTAWKTGEYYMLYGDQIVDDLGFAASGLGEVEVDEYKEELEKIVFYQAKRPGYHNKGDLKLSSKARSFFPYVKSKPSILHPKEALKSYYFQNELKY